MPQHGALVASRRTRGGTDGRPCVEDIRHTRNRRADGPERIHGEWWRRDREMTAVRDYFWVEDESGRRYWLFRRGDGDSAATGDLRWFVQGLA